MTLHYFRVLGVPVHAVQIPDVISDLQHWIQRRDRTRWVAVTGMHGITESRHDSIFRTALLSADLVVPDGMPLVWLGRYKGYHLQRRVYGPELMDRFCESTRHRYRHFFYGGPTGVANALADKLTRQYGIQVVGTYSPPFRPLTKAEDERVVALINSSRADVLWVGLSTPKQERWMHVHQPVLEVPAMLGVGAAFDLNLGRIRQAPTWMQEHGLEWLFRLAMEPRRLWRRYLLLGPQFVWNVSLEILRVRQYP